MDFLHDNSEPKQNIGSSEICLLSWSKSLYALSKSHPSGGEIVTWVVYTSELHRSEIDLSKKAISIVN